MPWQPSNRFAVYRFLGIGRTALNPQFPTGRVERREPLEFAQWLGPQAHGGHDRDPKR